MDVSVKAVLITFTVMKEGNGKQEVVPFSSLSSHAIKFRTRKCKLATEKPRLPVVWQVSNFQRQIVLHFL